VIYSLYKAILHYADWHASSKIPINYSLKYDNIDIHLEIEKRCVGKNIKFDELRSFQKECGSILGNVITIAPCGSGKTEASILWALDNLEDMKEGKLIYLLPTMVTANSIYRRLEDYFGKGNVGLSHSTASIMFEDDDEEYHEKDSRQETRNVVFDKSFIKPATVATIDQLLLAGFNTGKWCLIEANAANSVIVIDEIHSYDPWTLGLIVESIKHFSRLGTRFMLMSATMPGYLTKLFSDVIPNVKIVRDNTLSNVSRNRYKTLDKYIEEAIPDIEKSVKMGLKTLVILNTVSKCQELYNKLEYLKPICYHAKFVLNDRFEKEEIIELIDRNKYESKLLIATQVVEVSLDNIDFDNTFTECAPPDALVQRFGRNNRRGTKSNSNVNIYKASDKSKRIYDPDNDGLLLRTFDAFKNSQENLTEKDLINIVENVYSEIEIEKSQNFIDATCQYARTQERLMGIFDNIEKEDKDDITRKARYLQVPVIPTIFKNLYHHHGEDYMK
jgi:CRISPR-associated endonuclease/helicase Cas3